MNYISHLDVSRQSNFLVNQLTKSLLMFNRYQANLHFKGQLIHVDAIMIVLMEVKKRLKMFLVPGNVYELGKWDRIWVPR